MRKECHSEFRLEYTFSTNRVKGNWVEILGERPCMLCCDSLCLCFVNEQNYASFTSIYSNIWKLIKKTLSKANRKIQPEKLTLLSAFFCHLAQNFTRKVW